MFTSIGQRAMWLAQPFASKRDRLGEVDGIALRSQDGLAFTLAANEEARAVFSTADRVFVFPRAQAALVRLLASGIHVHRPVCGQTLLTLLGRSRASAEHLSKSAEDAHQRLVDFAPLASELITAIGEHPHKKVARLESLSLPAFAALEYRGLPIDVPAWQALVDDALAKEKQAEQDAYEALGDVVPRDLFGHPTIRLENDEDMRGALQQLVGTALPSINKYALAAIDHPVIAPLLQFREHRKVTSTYGKSFLAHVVDGRVHAHFNPLGAGTGRIASREPNLQNLPRAEAFHRCVNPGAGRALVTADYATCELRILAEFSKDPVFADAFARGEDLHSRVASEMFGVPVSKKENAELRGRAKAINFGLVYGMGAAALASSLDVSEREAEKLFADYFKRFPTITAYLEQSVDRALAQGFAQTRLGRRLYFDEEVLHGERARGDLSRIAKNMPIQGTSADMTKLAMVRVHERLRRDFVDAGLVNTIHDELVVECDDNEKDEVAIAVREEMEQAHSTLIRSIPPVVEVFAGAFWHHD